MKDQMKRPKLSITPITLAEANEFIRQHHRHHGPARGHKFSIAVADEAGEVRGVSFSYGGINEVMGATISAQMRLDNSYQPLNLNTPHKASDSYSDQPADEMQLSASCVKALKTLCEEVKAYIRGERAQGRLFDLERKAG